MRKMIKRWEFTLTYVSFKPAAWDHVAYTVRWQIGQWARCDAWEVVRLFCDLTKWGVDGRFPQTSSLSVIPPRTSSPYWAPACALRSLDLVTLDFPKAVSEDQGENQFPSGGQAVLHSVNSVRPRLFWFQTFTVELVITKASIMSLPKNRNHSQFPQAR